MGIFSWFKGEKSVRVKAAKLVLFGCTLANGKQYDEAISMFQKAIKIDESYAKAHYALGMMYSSKGMDDEANAAYNRAIKINPDYEAELKKVGVISNESFDVVRELGRIKND